MSRLLLNNFFDPRQINNLLLLNPSDSLSVENSKYQISPTCKNRIKMKVQIIFVTAILFIMTACNNKQSESPAEWSDEKVAEWYSEGEWQHGFAPNPDESVNQKEMAIRYYRNPKRWEKAFTFLAEQNLESLDTGKHELEGTDLYVMVDEYVPKETDSLKFEAHRNYADIQYVVSGQEKISIAPVDETIIVTAYDEETDVMYLSAVEAKDRIATPERFFVFFPSNAHRPSARVSDDSTTVKKIVVKVRLE